MSAWGFGIDFAAAFRACDWRWRSTLALLALKLTMNWRIAAKTFSEGVVLASPKNSARRWHDVRMSATTRAASFTRGSAIVTVAATASA